MSKNVQSTEQKGENRSVSDERDRGSEPAASDHASHHHTAPPPEQDRETPLLSSTAAVNGTPFPEQSTSNPTTTTLPLIVVLD